MSPCKNEFHKAGQMVKRLLVGIAGTPSLPAKIECAIDIAKRHRAEISLVSVVDVDRLSRVGPVPLGAGAYAQNMRDSRIAKSHALDENAIGKFEEACRQADVPVRTIRREDQPLDVLAAVWRYHDLCLLGARGWFDYGVMPEPEDGLLNLIAKGVRPILTVSETPRTVRRVMIAFNGSLQSAKAMKRFIQMALWPDVKIHIVCVGEPETGESAAGLLEEAAAYCKMYGHDPSTEQADGDVQDALLGMAESAGADLIVLGSSYRKLLMRQRFGRNALGLIQRSDVPLFMSH